MYWLYAVQVHVADSHCLAYVIITLAMIPQIVLTLYIVYKPLKGTALILYIQRNCRNAVSTLRHYFGSVNVHQTSTESEQYPDRLLNPHRYGPLGLPHGGSPHGGRIINYEDGAPQGANALDYDDPFIDSQLLSQENRSPRNTYGSFY